MISGGLGFTVPFVAGSNTDGGGGGGGGGGGERGAEGEGIYGHL